MGIRTLLFVLGTLSVIFAQAAAVPSQPAAADLAPRSPLAVEPAQTEEVAHYLRMRATVHVIRAAFDVEQVGDLPVLVAVDAQRAREDGVSAAELDAARTDLIAEGSYFIVAMQYLVEAGYPAWPEDRPPETYVRDALAVLTPLRAELIAAVDAGADVQPIMESAAEVYWWTEGSKTPVAGKADFAAIDDLLARATAPAPKPLPATAAS